LINIEENKQNSNESVISKLKQLQQWNSNIKVIIVLEHKNVKSFVKQSNFNKQQMFDNPYLHSKLGKIPKLNLS
jgi:DNA-binding NtrC family response regulator